MDAAFWHKCWEQDQLGFQLNEPHSLLQSLLPAILAQRAVQFNQIVLPLCGKSPDLLFCANFLPVRGVELSPIACQAFFNENKLGYTTSSFISPTTDASFVHYRSERIDIWQGDFFKLPDEAVSPQALIYDRAALIALPTPMREAYATKLMSWLRAGAVLFVISLEYPAGERQGPPFSVTTEDVYRLFPDATIALLADSDITGQGFGRRKMATGFLFEKAYLISLNN